MATVKKKPVTKSFDLSKYQVSDGTITKVIEVGEDSFEVRVKELSWFQRNTLMSKCMQIKGNAESSFDGALYVREVLKQIIVEAPWGKTTDLFLTSINNELGQALETLVASMSGDSEELSLEETKKG
jgi:hypothetical protein|tara:strand:- start:2730 stop:3110 length:381 start_codon:yes stop_codon:yes gene_type:complete